MRAVLGRSIAAALLLLGLQASAQAQEEDAELAELLDVLAEETEIATKTRMNSDYVPGIVTVLDAQTMSAMGARTVWDAMSFVPGVETWMDALAVPSMSVRGITFPFNSGSIQVLIDGIPIAAEAAGINGAALLMPIQQVERIEFVRGPGSVVYGDYAFQGLLNVVTRSSGSQFDLSLASDDEQQGNLRASAGNDTWKVSGQYASYNSDHAPAVGNRGIEETRHYAGLSLRRGGFALIGHGIGKHQIANDGRNPNLLFEESSQALELRYDWSLSPELQARFRLQHLDNDIRNPGIAFDGGHTEGGVDLIWSATGGQTWLAGLEYNRAEIDQASTRSAAAPGLPPINLILMPRDRLLRSAYVQGQFDLRPGLQATVGARYDDNEAIGSRVTPRASLVWRVADRHILKAQYAEGFRSPTFFELYVNPGQAPLDFEVNRTSEINYVYQRPGATARATLFRSRIDDMVFLDFMRRNFANIAAARSDGLELEYSRKLGSQWRWDAALGFADSEHNRNPMRSITDITAAADWHGNLGLLWTPAAHTAVGLRWTHVPRRDSVPREAAGYDRVDLSYTRRDVGWKGLELQLGVQNALDERIVYVFPAPNADNLFPYPRRTAFARLSWSWD